MKQLLYIIAAVSFSCAAQTVEPMYLSGFYENGVYYKDTFNDFDKFTGTWKYANGNTSLTIVLQKRLKQTKSYPNGDNFEIDFVIGGYKYIENGTEKMNSIPQLSQNLDAQMYYLSGYSILGAESSYCVNCQLGDKMIMLGFYDSNIEILGYEPLMFLKRVDSGGVQKIELTFQTMSGGIEEEGVTPLHTQYTLPFGTYILVKQ